MKKYELKTIKDIFDKVPAEKIEECMREIAQLMMESKKLKTGFDAVANVAGHMLGAEIKSTAMFPETITWLDDEKGDIKINVKVAVV